MRFILQRTGEELAVQKYKFEDWQAIVARSASFDGPVIIRYAGPAVILLLSY